MDPRTPRLMWNLFEPVHAVTYFAEEPRRAAAELGLAGFWPGYVVFRAAPLGPVAPAVVTAAFHGFAPVRVSKVLPQAWDAVSPAQAIDARATSTADALRAICAAAGIGDDHVTGTADALQRAAAAVDVAGRVLAAANAALPLPRDPYERLWQATTTLRGHRGDGHVATLVALGVSPVESHLLKITAGESEERSLRLGRAWDDEQWAAGRARLHDRGWTDPAGDLTPAGHAARDDVERRTDEAASGPWRALGTAASTEVAALLRPISTAVAASGVVPFPNPVGLGWPPPD
jgi:helix-turn-helix protein